MNTNEYIKNVGKHYKGGKATEHSYRGDLQQLIQSLVKGVDVTNEPKRQKCGAPDYIIQRKGVPLGYIEAKDVNADLDEVEKSEQMKRYLESIGENIILTDYLEFRFFKYGKKEITIRIADFEGGKVKPLTDNFEMFKRYIEDFAAFHGQTIKSSQRLAEMMAKKARMMEEVIYQSVCDDDEDNTLREQLAAFQRILIHDLDERTFADIYAQTIAYGLFAARLHDKTLDDFSREEALFLIPKSNPFLRQLFSYVAGPNLDERVVWIVNDLADIFRATDVAALLKDFGKATAQNDPFLHFYETFLAAYDVRLRKSRGVYYTPEPVVNFIVRAVDDILKTEFGIADGLASMEKTQIEVQTDTVDKRTKSGFATRTKEVHKVQILDPATGTGTFLAEVVKHIYKRFEGQEGIWQGYVDEHLLPRLHGFEILMASYTMCHLKLEILLRESGYTPRDDKKQQRLRVFLTNSLEEAHPDTGTLFASWLSREASEANFVKEDVPVMVVLGNPPYSVSSSNKGEWIQNLIKDYKKDLHEKKINLDDDYIKFIRYGEHFIERNGEGILAYISNNSFIDGITHRQMRKHLLETFDKIYILDLHGNAKKNETAPDGSKDENVFDIQQGVSINILLKTGKKKKAELGKIFHSELYGRRNIKYEYLNQNSISWIDWKKLDNVEPYLFFVPKDFKDEKEYKSGFKIDNLMKTYVSGFQTKRDKITINFSVKELESVKTVFSENNKEEIRNLFKLPADGRDWKVEWAKEDLTNNNPTIVKVMYRPFDERYKYFTGKSKGFVAYPRTEMFDHLNNTENISLITCRQQSTFDFQHAFISRLVSDMCNISSQTKETGYIFPLYLYPETSPNPSKGGEKEAAALFDDDEQTRVPNLNMEIVNEIAQKLGIPFTTEKTPTQPSSNSITPSPLGKAGMGSEKPGWNTADREVYPHVKGARDTLRKEMTEAERIIWEELRGKKLGEKFRRQHVIERFIVDFVCLSKYLVIEIDGDIHDTQKEHDEARTQILNQHGFRVIRFKNEDVINNLEEVLSSIKRSLSASPPLGDLGGPTSEDLECQTFAPIDLLDYIYAVLHSPSYREKYKEFLKIDFPRVPYPEDAALFWKLVSLGGELRRIHLLEHPVLSTPITKYPAGGSNIVEKPTYSKGRVLINGEQYFDAVPEVAWEFYIGGYQPAQKWLKDRKGRELSSEDIMHYQKIIVALVETDRLMKEVDEVFDV